MTQISTTGCMNKQNLIYPYNGILVTNKKEWTDTCCNIACFQNLSKSKESVTEDHIVYDSIYKKIPEQVTSQRWKVDQYITQPGADRGGYEKNRMTKGIVSFLGGD